MGQYQTFIVRFWSDPAATDVLRGHIQHIASGHGLYFRDLERMLHFMDEHRDQRPETPAGKRLNMRVLDGSLASAELEAAAKTDEIDVLETW
jgi:hypothetical protein